MFNAFTNAMQINDIRFLAYAVNAISSQQSVGNFCLNYNFANTTFVTKDDSTKPVSKHNARYDAVRTWIRQRYPDMHEAFIPHAVNMLIKEALETMNSPVHGIVTDIRKENGDDVFCSYLFPGSFSMLLKPDTYSPLHSDENSMYPDSAYRVLSIAKFAEAYQNNTPVEEILRDISFAYYDTYMKADFTQIYHGNEQELPVHFRRIAEKAAEEVLGKIMNNGGAQNE